MGDAGKSWSVNNPEVWIFAERWIRAYFSTDRQDWPFTRSPNLCISLWLAYLRLRPVRSGHAKF